MKWNSGHQWAWRGLWGCIICMPATMILSILYLVTWYQGGASSPEETAAIYYYVPWSILGIWGLLLLGDLILGFIAARVEQQPLRRNHMCGCADFI